jgi:hypothetical protein
MSGLDGSEPVLFLTLTAPGTAVLANQAAIRRWNAGIGRRWTHVVRDLRLRHPGVQLEFARVRELQDRGAEHVHALVRGVDFISHPVLMEIATRAGFGFVVWVDVVDDRKGAASYLGSYLAKSRQVFPARARVFTTSRRWRRGWTKRATEPGRFVSGPPGRMGWSAWADASAGVGPWLRRCRRQRAELASEGEA